AKPKWTGGVGTPRLPVSQVRVAEPRVEVARCFAAADGCSADRMAMRTVRAVRCYWLRFSRRCMLCCKPGGNHRSSAKHSDGARPAARLEVKATQRQPPEREASSCVLRPPGSRGVTTPPVHLG